MIQLIFTKLVKATMSQSRIPGENSAIANLNINIITAIPIRTHKSFIQNFIMDKYYHKIVRNRKGYQNIPSQRNRIWQVLTQLSSQSIITSSLLFSWQARWQPISKNGRKYLLYGTYYEQRVCGNSTWQKSMSPRCLWQFWISCKPHQRVFDEHCDKSRQIKCLHLLYFYLFTFTHLIMIFKTGAEWNPLKTYAV